MIIVSDSSPLVNLSRVNLLPLLHLLYERLLVPTAVWHEVVVRGSGRPGAETVANADWIQEMSVQNRALVQALQQELDEGEAEAIALALELDADLLLMDERLGRESAQHLGIRTVGLIGVCVEARHRQLLPSIRPVLDALRNEAGFWIRDELYHRVLADLDE